MPLTDEEKEILAEGEKLRVKIHTDTLNVRKSNLLKEIETVDQLLAQLVRDAAPEKPAEEPKAPEPAPARPVRGQSAKKTGA